MYELKIFATGLFIGLIAGLAMALIVIAITTNMK